MNNTHLFPTEYFSGNDLYISFNNAIIDEIVELQFVVQQAKIPIYGYASYTYDAMATGARIVQGSFKINFKESQYLYKKILDAQNTPVVPPSYESGPYLGMSDEELIKWMQGKTPEDIRYMSTEYYADIFGKTASSFDRSNQPYFDMPEGIDIIISYGELPLHRVDMPYEIGTYKTINNIHITSGGQLIKPVADNILEEYTFFARDVDGIITY